MRSGCRRLQISSRKNDRRLSRAPREARDSVGSDETRSRVDRASHPVLDLERKRDTMSSRSDLVLEPNESFQDVGKWRTRERGGMQRDGVVGDSW